MFKNITVVGGSGHIGLPLSLLFTKKGYSVNIFDKNIINNNKIRKNIMPFEELGGHNLLLNANKKKLLNVSNKIDKLNINGPIIICIGTPVDDFGNPTLDLLFNCIDELKNKINKNLLIFRSTLFPGSSKLIYNYLRKNKITNLLSFCPERVVQGQSIKEIEILPQIISAYNQSSINHSKKIFSLITKEYIICEPEEAELIKLFTNSYRYIKFAISNQFYNICKLSNINFNEIVSLMKHNYPRMKDLPSAGFAAGPCLYKDTIQLSSFSKNNFSLGNDALKVNEGFIYSIVDELKNNYELKNLNVGLLGMSFKANSDDIRASLSYKLKKQLKFKVKNVYTHDPHVKNDKELISINNIIKKSKVLILCVPHDYYKKINFKKKPIIDVWGYLTTKKRLKAYKYHLK